MCTFDSMMRGFILVFLVGIAAPELTYAQTNETINSGSFIVNMGSNSPSDGNSLKPYGMIYDLLRNYQVPVKWVINPTKGRDGIDFSHNGTDYKGGTFIIPAEFRTTTVNGRITFWQGQGVVGATSVSAITVPVYGTIKSHPRWAINQDKPDIVIPYLTAAGMPSDSYEEKAAVDLDNCDDIYLIPHDDNISSANLANWNNVYKGYIWVGCKSGSVMENTVANFLSTTGVTGNGGSWGNPSVTYDFNADPPMQFMGNTAHNQTQANGANRSYTPNAAWRPTTKKLIYITGQQRSAMVYGPAFGDTNRGYVMMSGGHDYNDNNPVAINRIALIRAMLNFSFMSVLQKSVTVAINAPAVLPGGTASALSYTTNPPGSYTTLWTSSCGGTFSPNATSASVNYTPPANATSCVVTVRITSTDGCGRVFFESINIPVACVLNVTRNITNVSCNGGANGAINMTITGGSAPYSWNWSRVSPAGTGSGTGTSITGLSAGTYNVTVTSPSGCSATFSALVNQPNAIAATATAVNPGCTGQNGSVNLSVNGGTPGYTYSWTGPSGFTATTQNLSNRPAGTYTVTVTDANACTGTASATIAAPGSSVAVALTSSTNVSCNGGTNGAINITASGGTPGYTYLWNNGATTEDRTGLGAGTYSVTVTDANGCTAVLSAISITQPAALSLSTVVTPPTCPPGATQNNADGAINLTVTGGTGTKTYVWVASNGGLVPPAQVNSEDLTMLRAGTYTVTVTDANGCTATTSVTLVNTNSNPVQPGVIINNN